MPSSSITSGASSAPSARPAIATVSTRPKTLPSSASGTIRWTSVYEATSIAVSPIPISTRAAIAAARVSKKAISSSGAPHSTRPVITPLESRPFPVSRVTTATPRSAPTPAIASRIPTHARPASSRSSAITTVNTESAPAISVWTPNRPRTSCSPRSSRTTRRPSRASSSQPAGSSAAGASGGRGCSVSANAAAQSSATAVATNVASMLETASRNAPSAGPRK